MQRPCRASQDAGVSGQERSLLSLSLTLETGFEVSLGFCGFRAFFTTIKKNDFKETRSYKLKTF